MKKHFIFLFLFCCLSLPALLAQPCFPDGYGPASQEEIDNFATLYPDCTELSAGLYIHSITSPQIENLEGLAQITRIEGPLSIDGMNALKSLHGLHNVTYIKSLNYDFSTGLEDVSGLEKLDTIDGGFSMLVSSINAISGMDSLKYIKGNINISGTSLNSWTGMNHLNYVGGEFDINTCNIGPISGMNNLKTITGNLRIQDNNHSGDISGWQNLETISGDIRFNSAYATSFVPQVSGFGQIKSIGGGIYMTDFRGLKDFSFLSGLTNLGGDIEVYYCINLESFSGLENLNTIGGKLEVSGTDSLKSMAGLENLISIGGDLNILECQNLASLHGLQNLTSIDGALALSQNFALQSLAGLENLETINGTLNISGYNELVNILALEKLAPSSITELDLTYNPKLSVCESFTVCNYINTTNPFNLFLNATGCNELNEVIVACSNTLSKVQYFTFYDLNQNQIYDTEEPIYADAGVQVDPMVFTQYSNDATGGTILLDIGNYVFSTLSNPLWELTTSPVEVPIEITEINSCDSIFFGFFPNQEESLIITAIQSPPTRCNEFITFEISAKNVGTTTEGGTLWLVADSNIQAVDFIQTPDTIVEPGLFGWHFTGLFPSQSINRKISLQIPGPPDFPLGENLNLFSYVDFTDQVWVQNATGFRYQPEVRCSYDPNDKLVNPNRDGNYTLFDEFLIYTVRFQNTGNDYARDVVIRDTLDTNLDASTFQVLSSSHENQLSTTLADGQFLTFDFSNIFLPDSTADFEGSQGYVSYLIKGVEGLAENTPIENTASIYFDFNPPIVTNTTQNVMVSEIPTTSTTAVEQLHFSIFPNPSKDQVQIIGENINQATMRLYDHLGRQLIEKQLQESNDLNLSKYPNGLYWIELSTSEAKSIQKIIKL